MDQTRRIFLRKSTLGFLGLGVVNSVFGQIVSSISYPTLTETILQKLTRAAGLRKGESSTMGTFIMMSSTTNLDDARDIYDQIITINPMEVRAHDGIRKILLQDKYNEVEVLSLFINSLNQSPTFLPFKARVAQEYMRIALGNKKFVNQLNSSQDLLLTSKELFDQIRVEAPTVQQYQVQYQKADFRLQHNSTTLDARDNPDLKVKRRKNRTAYQNRFDNMTSVEIDSRLQSLIFNQTKQFNQNRVHHLREVYKIYINKLVYENKIPDAVENCEQLYEIDPDDCNSLFLIRAICNKHKQYEVLEVIERRNNVRKNTEWSQLALYDVLLKRYVTEGYGNLNEMENIIRSIVTEDRSLTHVVEVKTREIKLAFAQSQWTLANNLLKSLADIMQGITSAHWIDRFNYLCIAYYKKNNDIEKSLIVINIALGQNELPITDLLLQKIQSVNKTRFTPKAIHNDRLNRLRSQLY